MSYALTDEKRVGGSNRFSLLTEAVKAAGRVFLELLRARRGRRELTRLATFDDAMLADIGITRSDVEWALLQPWNVDPSIALAMRSGRQIH